MAAHAARANRTKNSGQNEIDVRFQTKHRMLARTTRQQHADAADTQQMGQKNSAQRNAHTRPQAPCNAITNSRSSAALTKNDQSEDEVLHGQREAADDRHRGQRQVLVQRVVQRPAAKRHARRYRTEDDTKDKEPQKLKRESSNYRYDRCSKTQMLILPGNGYEQ